MVLYEAIEEQKQKLNELITKQEELGRALRQTANAGNLGELFEDVLKQTYSIEKNLAELQEHVTRIETNIYGLQSTVEDDHNEIKSRLEVLEQVLREAVGSKDIPIKVEQEH